MKISGLQKMTLLDFPGKVACTVFLQGCNFRCPFCHNSGLLGGGEDALMTDAQLMEFLKKRRGLLDGVCISGGEPTLSPGLAELMREIKKLGLAVKLDTNGSRPDVIRQLVNEGLVDYIAMDVKNSPAGYPETAGCRIAMEKIEESLRFLLTGAVDYELRTTVVRELHSENSIREMGEWLSMLASGRKVKKFFLQPFVDRESVLLPGLHAPDEPQMACYCSILEPFVQVVEIRG